MFFSSYCFVLIVGYNYLKLLGWAGISQVAI